MKYLFKALLKDGSLIEQTQEDVSQKEKDKNAFYDVLQQIKEVRAFALYNQETQAEYLVDLLDGHFEINQVPFFMHNEFVSNIRLVFFKRNTINFTTREVLPVQYNFGFQANDNTGKNVQYVMTIF